MRSFQLFMLLMAISSTNLLAGLSNTNQQISVQNTDFCDPGLGPKHWRNQLCARGVNKAQVKANPGFVSEIVRNLMIRSGSSDQTQRNTVYQNYTFAFANPEQFKINQANAQKAYEKLQQETNSKLVAVGCAAATFNSEKSKSDEPCDQIAMSSIMFEYDQKVKTIEENFNAANNPATGTSVANTSGVTDSKVASGEFCASGLTTKWVCGGGPVPGGVDQGGGCYHIPTSTPCSNVSEASSTVASSSSTSSANTNTATQIAQSNTSSGEFCASGLKTKWVCGGGPVPGGVDQGGGCYHIPTSTPCN